MYQINHYNTSLIHDTLIHDNCPCRNCTARHRVAIIVPYRDRELHLRTFLLNIHSFLSRQMLDYGVFIVEQFGPVADPFNRAMLMNVGAAEAVRDGRTDTRRSPDSRISHSNAISTCVFQSAGSAASVERSEC